MAIEYCLKQTMCEWMALKTRSCYNVSKTGLTACVAMEWRQNSQSNVVVSEFWTQHGRGARVASQYRLWMDKIEYHSWGE